MASILPVVLKAQAVLDDRAGPREALMPTNDRTDNLASAVRYALETTRAVAVCPFHRDVSVRVGDDAAESHAFARACKIVKSDGTTWDRELLREEMKRQLGDAADGACPACACAG
jgi:hypothetical protein